MPAGSFCGETPLMLPPCRGLHPLGTPDVLSGHINIADVPPIGFALLRMQDLFIF